MPNTTVGTNAVALPITDVGSYASCVITGASNLTYSRRTLTINKE